MATAIDIKSSTSFIIIDPNTNFLNSTIKVRNVNNNVNVHYSYLGAQIVPVAAASLPTCDFTTIGLEYLVTNATLPTYNATLVGGGTTIVPVVCNGSGWTTH